MTTKEEEQENLVAFEPEESNTEHAIIEITVMSSDSDENNNSDSSSSEDKSIARVDSDVGSNSSDNSSTDNYSIASSSSGFQSQSLQWRNLISGLIMRKKRSMVRMSTFPPVTRSSSLRAAVQKFKSSRDQTESKEEISVVEFSMAKPTWRNFDYAELATATDNFSPERLIGKGGHAEVYKGYLADGELVAVKRLTRGDNEAQRTADFLAELGIIAHVNHPNAAQLLGFSIDRGLHLILKFSPHGSLASVLHGTEISLDWKTRFQIAIGIADGLLYLHEGCQRRIIHRDIKASNVLLTEDFRPQISDFGLAKWLPNKWNHHIVHPIEGTFGYMAPEYFMHGVVNEKIDVFAYGVLLLELITGRKAVDLSRRSLVIWAKPLLDENKVSELVDSSLGDAYDSKEMSCALQVASMCIHHLSTSRPSMNEVVRLLRGEEGLSEMMIGRESRYKVTRPPFLDGCEMEDYTCSRYLNDLSKHKQLALEQ